MSWDAEPVREPARTAENKDIDSNSMVMTGEGDKLLMSEKKKLKRKSKYGKTKR